MASSTTAPEPYDHDCLTIPLIGGAPAPVNKVECRPNPPVIRSRYTCLKRPPSSITVSWTNGDDKEPYWPSTMVIPPEPSVQILTSLLASGSRPTFILTFDLVPEVLQAYYDEIGPITSWLDGKRQNPPQWNFNWDKLNPLAANLYALREVRRGTILTATTTTITENWVNGVKACDDTAIDITTWRNVIVGTTSVTCNIRDLSRTMLDGSPFTIFGTSLAPTGGKTWFMITGQIAAGMVVTSKNPSSRLFERHVAWVGQLPGLGYQDVTLTWPPGDGGGFGGPYSFTNLMPARNGMGWPTYVQVS